MNKYKVSLWITNCFVYQIEAQTPKEARDQAIQTMFEDIQQQGDKIIHSTEIKEVGIR